VEEGIDSTFNPDAMIKGIENILQAEKKKYVYVYNSFEKKVSSETEFLK
jgi:hypothetical protein